MNSKKTPLLILAAAGMELSWLMAAAVLLLSFVGVSPLALPQALAAFLMGTGLTLFMQKRKWRIIYRMAPHIMIIFALLLLSLYGISHGGILFRDWLEAFWQGPQDMRQGLLWAAVFFVILIFWGGGLCLARRSLAYFTTTSRFDVGIAMFILIFIIAGVTGAPVMPLMLFLFPFFLTSMVAIALARNQKGDERGVFQLKYRGNGPILAFAAAVLLGGGTVILFLLPFLTLAAEAGYSAMMEYGTPLSILLGRLILFMFGYGRQMRRSVPVEDAGTSYLIDPESVAGGETGFWGLLVSWASVGLIIAAGLFVAGWSLWHLLRWLLSGAENSGERWGMREILLSCLQKLRSVWQRMQRWIRGSLSFLAREQKRAEAAYFFRRLRLWGRWSGFDCLAADTPQEYGLILGHHFPEAHAEIELIIHCFHEEVYGEMLLDRGQKRRLRRAWRRLCSPRRWPVRFYKRLVQGSNTASLGFNDLKSGVNKQGDKKADYGGDI